MLTIFNLHFPILEHAYLPPLRLWCWGGFRLPVRVVAVEIPVPDRLDSPRRAYQRLEVPAIFGGQFLRCIQQLFNSPQNDIFGFVEDVISFSGQLHVFTPFRLLTLA